MLDILLLTYFVPANKHDPEHKKKPSAYDDLMHSLSVLIVVVATILALVCSYKRRAITSSYSADLVISCFAPITYWILFAFGATSHPIALKS